MTPSLDAYSVLLFVAIHVGVFLTERRLRRDGESLVERPWVLLVVLLLALAGGRAHFLVEGLVRGTIELANVGEWLTPFRGGSTFYGTMAGLLAGLAIFRRALPYRSVPRLLDAGVPGLAAGIAIGRLGCLANGCCLGAVTDRPWSLPLEPHRHDPEVAEALARMASAAEPGGVGLHPLVIYLGAWALVSGWLATRLADRAAFRGRAGSTILLFAGLFALGRFVLEAWRLAPGGELAGINAARWESLAVTAAVGIALAVRAGSGRATGREH